MPAARLALRPSRSPSLLALAALATALACRVSIDTNPPGDDAAKASKPARTAATGPAAAPKIDPARMLADVQYLASDELRGRFTFSDDLGVAADHLAKQYETIGLAPVGGSYRVPFMVPSGFRPSEDEVVVWVEDAGGGKIREVASDVITAVANGKGKPVYAEAFGVRTLEGAKPAMLRGKIVIAPAPAEGLVEAIQKVASAKAAGLVLVSDQDRAVASGAREPLRELEIPVVWLTPDAAEDWLGATRAGPKQPFSVDAGTKLSLSAKKEPVERESFNVLAVLPGATKPEEVVILGAHYDHIGTSINGFMCREEAGDTICNGADDNASGTAMVLEIARTFAAAKYRPARTIVFAHFAGEELGLYGSNALAEKPPKAPPFEGGKVVAMVNLDMVGRLGENGLAIGGVGSSDAWMPLLDELGARDMTIVYERAINGRSDHANFYRKKVPVLFFFTGLHDDYHQAGDHFEAINREGMATIGQLVADLTRALGDGAAVAFAPPRNDDEGVVARMPGSDDSSVEKRTGPAGTKPAGKAR